MKSPTDASLEAERILDEAYRAMSSVRKRALLVDLDRMGRDLLPAAGVRLRNPTATPAEVRDVWIATQVGEVARMTPSEEHGIDPPMGNLRVLREVLDAFESLANA